MMRGVVEYAFEAKRLDDLFEDATESQYTRTLHFSTVADLMSEVEIGRCSETFMPAAERYGLATRLDQWVVQAAFTWLNRHPKRVKPSLRCFINLSGGTLADDAFLEFVIGQFSKTKIAPDRICFEITETAAITNLTSAMRFIDALKRVGCHFSLDDFGSGLSSLAYLKNFPVDYLKIDGAFVKDIATDPIDFAMVKAINEIGHVMGKKTIAEFVENETIITKLREIGVDFYQGYGVGRPRPIENL